MSKKIKFIIIAAVAFCIILSGNIYSSVKSYKYRIHLDTARKQLVRAEEYNRELTERLGNISTNVQKLGELTEKNISGVRECIEIIEETRVIIEEMENSIYGSDSIDNYYNHWDNEFRKEGLGLN